MWSRSPENSQQVTKLAQNLPVYQYNLEERIRSARGFAGGAMLEWISNFLGDLNEEVLKKNDTPPGGATSQRNEEPAKPIPVEVPTRCDASAGRPAGAGAASRSTNDSGARRHIRHLLPITAPRSEGPSDPTRRIPRLARARASARKNSMRWFFTREGENVGQEGLDVHRVSTGIPDRPWRLARAVCS